MKLTDQKKLAILHAAELLFIDQGVEQTSMEHIAKQANVSKRTLYNHFETKDILFHAVLFRLHEQIQTNDRINYTANDSIRNQLTAIARQEVALLTSEKFMRMARVAFMHILQHPELAQQLSTSKVGCLAYLDDFLIAACSAGALKIDDIPFAAKQFVYQLKGFVLYPNLYQIDVPSVQQTNAIIDETVKLFLSRYQA